jgi:hypothetical protein
MKYLTKDEALKNFDSNEISGLNIYFKLLDKKGKERKESIRIVKEYIGNISGATAGKILDFGIYY